MISVEHQRAALGKTHATVPQKAQELTPGDGSFFDFLSRDLGLILHPEAVASSTKDSVDQADPEKIMEGSDVSLILPPMVQLPAVLDTESADFLIVKARNPQAESAAPQHRDSAELLTAPMPEVSEPFPKHFPTISIPGREVKLAALPSSLIVPDAQPVMAPMPTPFGNSLPQPNPAPPLLPLDRAGKEIAPTEKTMHSTMVIVPLQMESRQQVPVLFASEPNPMLAPQNAQNVTSSIEPNFIAPMAEIENVIASAPNLNNIPASPTTSAVESVQVLPSVYKIESSPTASAPPPIPDGRFIQLSDPIIAEVIQEFAPKAKLEILDHSAEVPVFQPFRAWPAAQQSVAIVVDTSMGVHRSAIVYGASLAGKFATEPTQATPNEMQMLPRGPGQPILPPHAPQTPAGQSMSPVQLLVLPDRNSASVIATDKVELPLAMPMLMQPSPLAQAIAPQASVPLAQAPVSIPDLAAQIKDHTAPGKPTSVELALAPEELGKIRLILMPDGDKLRVVIQAERPETMELLRRNTEGFTAELRQSGFASTSFSFSSWGESPQRRSHQADNKVIHWPEDAAPAVISISEQIKTSGSAGLDLRI